MARRSRFDSAKFLQENPVTSLIFIGGIGFLGYTVYKQIKKGRAGTKEESEKNPFNYTVFMSNTEEKAQRKKQSLKVYTLDEAKKFAEKLHKTWGTVTFDYPEEAKVIIQNMPSKYDFAKVLTVYNSTYGYDYQSKIKDKYNEDNYNMIIETALDIPTDYRITK